MYVAQQRTSSGTHTHTTSREHAYTVCWEREKKNNTKNTLENYVNNDNQSHERSSIIKTIRSFIPAYRLLIWGLHCEKTPEKDTFFQQQRIVRSSIKKSNNSVRLIQKRAEFCATCVNYRFFIIQFVVFFLSIFGLSVIGGRVWLCHRVVSALFYSCLYSICDFIHAVRMICARRVAIVFF